MLAVRALNYHSIYLHVAWHTETFCCTATRKGFNNATDFHVNYLLDNSILYQPADKREHNNLF